jgi:putative NADH-flavin reductase
MKLFVIGATGRTGRKSFIKLWQRGHHVTALVRSPEGITLKNERLTVLKGSAMDENQLFDAIAAAMLSRSRCLSSARVSSGVSEAGAGIAIGVAVRSAGASQTSGPPCARMAARSTAF